MSKEKEEKDYDEYNQYWDMSLSNSQINKVGHYLAEKFNSEEWRAEHEDPEHEDLVWVDITDNEYHLVTPKGEE